MSIDLEDRILETTAEADVEGLGLRYSVWICVDTFGRIPDLLATSVAMTTLHLYKVLVPDDGIFLWDALQAAIPSHRSFSDDPDFSPLLGLKVILRRSHSHPYGCPYTLQLEPTFEGVPQAHKVGCVLAHFLEDYYLFVKHQVLTDQIARGYLQLSMQRINEVYAWVLNDTPPDDRYRPTYQDDERLLSVEGELRDLWRQALRLPPSIDPTLGDFLAGLSRDHKDSN